ncbi:hypothetical protein [Methanobrevibacter sp.]|nr:hypothetical protein [Methanobrevibacter sp.]
MYASEVKSCRPHTQHLNTIKRIATYNRAIEACHEKPVKTA